MKISDLGGTTRSPYFIHLSLFSSLFLLHRIMSPCSLEICRLTASHASPPSRNISASPLCRSIIVSPSPPLPPLPSTSFWRLGRSEVAAVCIAKGNVSGTRRKKWVRTLERSLHILRGWRRAVFGPVCTERIRPLLLRVDVATSHHCLLVSIIDGGHQLTGSSPRPGSGRG